MLFQVSLSGEFMLVFLRSYSPEVLWFFGNRDVYNPCAEMTKKTFDNLHFIQQELLAFVLYLC